MLSLNVRGCDIKITAGFFLIVTLVLIKSDNQIACLSLAASVLHETGHIIAMKISGVRIKKLTVSAIGFCIENTNEGLISLGKETAVDLAGIGMNLILALISYILFIAKSAGLFKSFCIVNLIIGAFNFLPVDTLDGARALYTLLSKLISVEKAYSVISFLSVTVTGFIAFLCVYAVLTDKANISLTAAGIYFIILTINRFVRLKT